MVAKRDLTTGHDDLDDSAGLSDEEARTVFDEAARYELGISGEEFLRRWDAGEFRPVPDTPDGRKIGRLVMILDLVR